MPVLPSIPDKINSLFQEERPAKGRKLLAGGLLASLAALLLARKGRRR